MDKPPTINAWQLQLLRALKLPPDTAVLRRFEWHADRGTLSLYVDHDDLPVLEEGMAPPLCSPAWTFFNDGTPTRFDGWGL